MINEEKISKFKRDGYIHIKNFFDEQEINAFLNVIEKKNFFIKNENIDRTADIEETWDFICNKKMLEVVRSLIGDKIQYLHDVNILISSKNTNYTSTWHRDNPCRRTGVGPDWNSKEEYKVVRAIVYLEESNSTLNVIKKSHFKSYKFSISNILRIIDSRLRNFRKLSFLKKIIIKLIGRNLKYKSGDLVIFYTTLYHTGKMIKDSKNSSMSAIIAGYGGEGSHTKTFLNYEMNYRKGLEKYDISKKKNIFFQKLMDNEIYISPQTPKEKIDGIFIPRDQDTDSIYLKNKA